MKIEDVIRQQIVNLFGDLGARIDIDEKYFAVTIDGASVQITMPEEKDLLNQFDLMTLIENETITINKVVNAMESEVDKADDEERTIRMVGTLQTEDRLGDIIDVKGWQLKNYKKNPVILFAHDHRSPAVAKATEIEKTDNSLIFTLKFPPVGVYQKSDELYGLYKHKIMKASSVGFIPIDYEFRKDKEGGIHFKKQELLELSLVTVPAHQDALALSLYGEYEPKENYSNIVEDVRKIQEKLDSLSEEMNRFRYSVEAQEMIEKVRKTAEEIKRRIKEVM